MTQQMSLKGLYPLEFWGIYPVPYIPNAIKNCPLKFYLTNIAVMTHELHSHYKAGVEM